MKLIQKATAVSVAAASFLSAAPAAFAANYAPVDPCTTFTNPLCKKGGSDLGGLIGNVIYTVFIIAALIALFYLIWGGIKWITSGGDKAKVESARGTIIAAIVGLVIVFLSFFILNFVLGFFNLSLSGFTLPTLF